MVCHPCIQGVAIDEVDGDITLKKKRKLDESPSEEKSKVSKAEKTNTVPAKEEEEEDSEDEERFQSIPTKPQHHRSIEVLNLCFPHLSLFQNVLIIRETGRQTSGLIDILTLVAAVWKMNRTNSTSFATISIHQTKRFLLKNFAPLRLANLIGSSTSPH
jgi:hypothetical protein